MEQGNIRGSEENHEPNQGNYKHVMYAASKKHRNPLRCPDESEKWNGIWGSQDKGELSPGPRQTHCHPDNLPPAKKLSKNLVNKHNTIELKKGILKDWLDGQSVPDVGMKEDKGVY